MYMYMYVYIKRNCIMQIMNGTFVVLQIWLKLLVIKEYKLNNLNTVIRAPNRFGFNRFVNG